VTEREAKRMGALEQALRDIANAAQSANWQVIKTIAQSALEENRA